MLKDRLKTDAKLYKNGVAPKIIVTGDRSYEQYSEVASDYELDETREVLARYKDFMTTIIRPRPANTGKTYSKSTTHKTLFC